MAYSTTTYVSDGVTSAYSVPFPYLNRAHVFVRCGDGTFPTFVWTSATRIAFNAGVPAAGVPITVYRSTSPGARLVTYTDTGGLTSKLLNTEGLQEFYLDQELSDRVGGDEVTLAHTIRVDGSAAPLGAISAAAANIGGYVLFSQGQPLVATGNPPTATVVRQDIYTLKTPLLPNGTFADTWGFSTAVPHTGEYIQLARALTAPQPSDPTIWLESVYSANAPTPVDFAGAYLSSIPLGLYVQHTQNGTDPSNNAGTHSIMAYGINNAAGNNDVVAVSGRVRKLDVPGGVGDACGVWGSAYAESTQTGGVMGMETHIYNNAPGQLPSDRLNSKWAIGFHVYSDSLGSPALAGVAIDSSGQSDGRFGFYNAIIIDKNCFAGGHLEGTVGINMGSCDAFNNPEYGIKFGACWQSHIYGQASNLSLSADNSIFLDVNPVTSSMVGGTSVFVDLGGGNASNFIIRSNGTPIFQVFGHDGSVHIRRGTVISADL